MGVLLTVLVLGVVAHFATRLIYKREAWQEFKRFDTAYFDWSRGDWMQCAVERRLQFPFFRPHYRVSYRLTRSETRREIVSVAKMLSVEEHGRLASAWGDV